MSKNQTTEIKRFLKPFSKRTRDIALWLRVFVWDLYPEANELIYDNYNALAVGWSLSERVSHVFCTMSAWRTNGSIHFGFYYGIGISDPKGILMGNGKQYRYILVSEIDQFPVAYMKKLLKQSHANAHERVKDVKQICNGKTITKSVSTAKRTSKNKVSK